jgi:hypothetical protein
VFSQDVPDKAKPVKHFVQIFYFMQTSHPTVTDASQEQTPFYKVIPFLQTVQTLGSVPHAKQLGALGLHTQFPLNN